MATEGAVLEIFWTGAVSGQVWVEHPLSMAASVCLKFSGGGNTLLEWQTYKVNLNNGSLLILMKFLLLFYLLCCHFFLYSLSLPHRVSFLVAFLIRSVPGSGHLKLGWGHLCPWVWQYWMLGPSHGPAAPPLEVFPSITPPEVLQPPPLSDSLLRRSWFSSSDEISFACADAFSKESCAIVSVT